MDEDVRMTRDPPPDPAVGPPDLGTDTGLSFADVARMTFGNVRARLGRSAITLFGVVLGTAFLMAVTTSSQLRRALAEEDALRRAAADTFARTAAELGTLDGRVLAVVVERWDAFTAAYVRRLAMEPALTVRIFAGGTGARAEGAQVVATAAEALADASALILCNRDADTPSQLPPGVAALRERMVMDLAGRLDAAALADRGLHYADLGQADVVAGLFAPPVRDQRQETARSIWLITVSLLVSGIGIANALAMSVTERFREIGTLKCLGARDRLVVQMFIMESAVLGLAGAAVGVGIGFFISIGANAATYGPSLVWRHLPGPALAAFALGGVAVGVVVAMVAAIYPAVVAARMTSADALRSEV